MASVCTQTTCEGPSLLRVIICAIHIRRLVTDIWQQALGGCDILNDNMILLHDGLFSLSKKLSVCDDPVMLDPH